MLSKRFVFEALKKRHVWFFQLFKIAVDIQYFVSFRYTVLWFDTYITYEVIPLKSFTHLTLYIVIAILFDYIP